MSLSEGKGNRGGTASRKPYFGGGYKKRGGRGKGTPTKATYQPKFEGKTEELKSHIYDMGMGNQADLFTRTTNEIMQAGTASSHWTYALQSKLLLK